MMPDALEDGGDGLAARKPRIVSFNRDVHVKRIGKPRELPRLAVSPRQETPSPQPILRKESFTHLSKEQLAEEAAKVVAQAGGISCSVDGPEKFFSLPYRKKKDQTENRGILRRRSEELGVTAELPDKKFKLASLFKRPDRDLSYSCQEDQISVPKGGIIKRSKSDVSDLWSNSKFRPIRKRSGSASEEYLNSVKDKKNQLTPIIEKEDYFKAPEIIISTATPVTNYKLNPIEKPPRLGADIPKPPKRTKRKEAAKEKTDVKSAVDLFEKMVHSSQKPAEKLPLTKGQTVDPLVKILREDRFSPPPRTLITPPNASSHNNNQPFSYLRPSVSPDARTPSPNTVYAEVKKGNAKQVKKGPNSDEDEGLGFEEHLKWKHDEVDSPITPRLREFKTKYFDYEPTYANEFTLDRFGAFRGRGDGVEAKKRDFVEERQNDLSHRRQLLESRMEARRFGDTNRERYDPMEATRRYVSETTKYYKESSENERYDDVSPLSNDRREFIDKMLAEEPKDEVQRKSFPPEPEYEPPSLDSNFTGHKFTPDEYIDKKYKPKVIKELVTTHEPVETSRYVNMKHRHEKFGYSREHYASNPEIAVKGDMDSGYLESFHNSLKRDKRRDFVDSGIENDYRKGSSGDINPRIDSDDEGFASSQLIASERQHTEWNHRPMSSSDSYAHRERSIDDGSHYDPRIDRLERVDIAKVAAKPPKGAKKISGLEKVKQLFSRDSSKKSKKEKEKETKASQEATAVMLPREEIARTRYREYRGSSEDPDSDYKDARSQGRRIRSGQEQETEIREEVVRQSRIASGRRVEEHMQEYDYSQRRRLATPSPSPSPPRRVTATPPRDRRITATPPRDRRVPTTPPRDRRVATTPPRGRRVATTPPRERRRPSPQRPSPPTQAAASGWFKSLDRLTRKKSKSKVDKDIQQLDDSPFTKSQKPPIPSPAKNLRFFGDTDGESDPSLSRGSGIPKHRPSAQRYTPEKSSGLVKTSHNLSNSAQAINSLDRRENSHKSSSLTNLREDDRPPSQTRHTEYRSNTKRNLHNISENHSNSEVESFYANEKYEKRRYADSRKPPMSPLAYAEKPRSRSQGSAKLNKDSPVRDSKGDLRKNGYSSRNGDDSRGSSAELSRSRQDLSSSRSDLKSGRRRKTPNGNGSAGSSTEGESSQQSQRSIVYLHATTVGDIPGPERISRGRSRDDVSSVNSSRLQPQVKTVSRSFSLLAPWRPRHIRDSQDINYSQSQNGIKKSEPSPALGPTKRKSASTRNLAGSRQDVRDERDSRNPSLNHRSKMAGTKSVSNSNNSLFRKSDRVRDTPIRDGYPRDRDYSKSRSTEVLSNDSYTRHPANLERSTSMPKSPSKSAGWFKIKSAKKMENANRMR